MKRESGDLTWVKNSGAVPAAVILYNAFSVSQTTFPTDSGWEGAQSQESQKTCHKHITNWNFGKKVSGFHIEISILF